MKIMTPLEKSSYFYGTTLLICLSYLLYQFFYNAYSILGVDDFGFAHAIYEYKSGLPYRDFPPYKTVLGNYILLIPMLLTKGLLSPLIYTKDLLALLNAAAFFAAAAWMKRFFSKAGVLCSVILLIGAEFTLSNSTNIRADLLSYWLCLFSILLVMENRFILGGILLGLGFAVSQKVLWYAFASDCALGVHWLLYARDRKFFGNICLFNFSVLAVILAYLAFWSGIANVQAVLHSVFYEAYVMYKLDFYDASRFFYWVAILYYNPLPFLLWPLTFISLVLVPQHDRQYKKRLFLVIYASAVMFCLIRYKQVFPYYMLTLLPALLLLYAGFFSWVYEVLQKNVPLKIKGPGKKGLWGLITLYSAGVVLICLQFYVPLVYLLMLLPSLGLGIYATVPAYFKDDFRREALASLIVLSFLFTGLVYPLCALMGSLPNKSSAYQKSVLGLMETLLQDGSAYVAGVELIYNKDQPIPGMRQMEIPAIHYLSTQSEKLRPFMSMASLCHTPDATEQSVIEALKKSRVKLYINNYRMEALPATVKAYLDSEYQHYWGSLYLYAPQISAGRHPVEIKFPGAYLIESKAPVELDGKTYSGEVTLEIKPGQHNSAAKNNYRLKLLPAEGQALLNPDFQKDDWDRML